MTLREYSLILLAAPLLFACSNSGNLSEETSTVESDQVQVKELTVTEEVPTLEAIAVEPEAETEAQEVTMPPAEPAPSGIASPKPTSSPTTESTPPVTETEEPRPSANQPAELPSQEEISTEQTITEEETPPPPPDHFAWDEILKLYVSNSGNVYYSRLKNSEAKLDAYLATLAEATPDKSWGRNAAMAYWINAYNAFTVKRILDNWPLKSIMDLDGGKTWDVKWIELAGKTYSLNQIEHEILRPQYNDARIHFAVNCAAASCPPLANRAFTADNLNGMLENLTRRFVNNGRYNRIQEGSVRVSKIFDWYGSDFGNLRDYLNKYLENPIPETTEIGFQEYDWSLNN